MAAPTKQAVRQFGSFLRAYGFIHRNVSQLTATTTLRPGEHSGRTNMLDAVAGFACTLPAAKGKGNRYRFVVKTALTSAQYRFSVTSTDTFLGGTFIGDSGDTAAATADFFVAAAASNQLNMTLANGGGSVGDWVEFEDVATGKWLIHGVFRDVTDPSNRFAAV